MVRNRRKSSLRKKNGYLVTVHLAVVARINSADIGVLFKDYLGIEAFVTDLPSIGSCFNDGTISASDLMA